MKKSKRLLSLALSLLMVLSLIPAMALPSLAAAGDPINATLDADNGTINFDGAADSATLSYTSDGEKDYNMKVVLTFPASATGKSATITLAEGLKFQDDGSTDATLATLLNGAVVNSTNAVPYGLSTSMTGTGSKTYDFIDGADTLTINLIIRADCRYWFDSAIADAIKVTMDYNGSQQDEVKLESLTVNSSNKRLHTGNGDYIGYAATDTNIVPANGYRLYFFSMSSWTNYYHFVKSFESTFTVDDPNCVVTNTDPANWTMTDNGGGSYTFTYKGVGGAGLINTIMIPVQFNFPSSDFSAGDVITVTRTAKVEFYGGKVATSISNTLKYTILPSGTSVFVNYETMTSAVSAGTLNGSLADATGSTSPTLSGAVGRYTVGNKGGTNSGAQTIELHFDDTKLGVLALYLVVPYYQADGVIRETVTTVEYQTVSSPGVWQTKTGLNITAESAIAQTRYISWSTLGITTDPMTTGDYITAIRYTVSNIPAATVLGSNDASTYRNGIYGVTLSVGVGTTATSTVSVYDPADAGDTSKWVTGKIDSDHTRNYVGISFNAVSSVSVSKPAGETLSFSQRITSVHTNALGNMYSSSAIEHPVIYLRSESGNQITNIKIVNSRGTDITSYLIITPSYDGSVWTYKIDTANVPGDDAAIAYHSVQSSGSLGAKYITVSYDILTQATDSGTYSYVDMLFVETPISTLYSDYPTNNAQSAAGYGPNSIGTGSGRVWWLPTNNLGSYTIIPRTDIVVSLSAKHHSEPDTAYETWSPGSAPVAIGVGSNSVMDIRLDVENLSGLAVTNDTIIYMPIPKVGDDWGFLLYNGDPIEFSVVLVDEVSLPSGVTGTLTYGAVTPTDNGTTLNGYTFEAWNSANASNYNCIKIVLNGLADSAVPVSIDMSVTVDTTSVVADGLLDTWSPLYYEDLTNSVGDAYTLWVQGTYLASETAMGEIQGWIWLDDNGDGVKGAAETRLTITAADGWTVDVYVAGTVGSGSPIRTVKIGEDSDGTAKNNYYHITDIITGSGNYDLVVNNPDNTVYNFTVVGSGAADNKASGTAADSHATGMISDPTAGNSTVDTLGVYNIGVVDMWPTVTYKANAGSGADYIETVNPGTDSTVLGLSATSIRRSGYTFQGWNDAADGSGTAYNAGDIIYSVASDVILYAQWSGNSGGGGGGTSTYTVTYTANGGTDNDYKVSGISSGSTHIVRSVSDAAFSRESYTFAGWNTRADGSGTAYATNDSLTITGNVTLYAQWTSSADVKPTAPGKDLLNTDDHLPYIFGYPDGSVQAENNITRAEVASIFYRLLKNQGTASSDQFSDVSSDAWYARAVNYLASLDILNGYPDGTFRPNDPITRAEFAAIASRFDELSSSSGNVFDDVSGSHWAVSYINSAAVKGWVSGYPDGTFRPDNNISRSEVVSIVNTMLGRAIDEDTLQKIENPYNDIKTAHWAYADIIEASYDHEYSRSSDGTESWDSWIVEP